MAALWFWWWNNALLKGGADWLNKSSKFITCICIQTRISEWTNMHDWLYAFTPLVCCLPKLMESWQWIRAQFKALLPWRHNDRRRLPWWVQASVWANGAVRKLHWELALWGNAGNHTHWSRLNTTWDALPTELIMDEI